MNNKEIMECLQEQLGKPVQQRKIVEENKLFILDGIIAGDLPVYRKWVWNSMLTPDESKCKMIFRIDIIQGRLECDRIKFEDKGQVEFDTGNHSIVLDTDFQAATEDEWNNSVHKLMKYIRNGN
tara:strand:+ start:881 stop:1252 length:372 start_codon:yes stop_codon:yes gene_type:complete